MIKFIIYWALVALVRAITPEISAKEILGFIEHAEDNHTNWMSKRGSVYRAIRERLPETYNRQTLYLVLEMGLYIYKLRNSE